jgi:cardiolipin synthase
VNVPNFLTVLRIVLVPVIVILLMEGQHMKALVCFVVAGVTDGLDGLIARRFNQMTVVGAYLDPLADKILVISMFATLAVIGIVPGWLAVLVISRDCIILGGLLLLTLMSVSLQIRPSFVSKVNTALQLITLFVALVMNAGEAGKYMAEVFVFVCWTTAAFTVASGADYLWKGMKLISIGNGKAEKS